MTADLEAVLRAAGIEPTVGELMDALWLAGHLPSTKAPVRRPAETATPPEPGPIADANQSGTQEPTAEPVPPAETDPPVRDLVAVDRRTSSPMRVRGTVVRPRRRVAETGSQIAIGRALRPLGRRVPGATATVLDETATVTRIADEGIWSPVLRPALERWLSLDIVLDTGPSMAPWLPWLDRFGDFLSALRLFRELRLHTLEEFAFQPTRRRTILVVTDGIDAAWRTSERYRVVTGWGSSDPVAVGVVLPPRMWPGTGIRAVGAQAKTIVAGAANRHWLTRPRPGADDWNLPAVPVPVTRLTPDWLSTWSNVVGGSSRWTDVVLLAEPGGGGSPASATAESPRELVRRFRLVVSPLAFRLACLLSAAVYLDLNAIRAIRDLMLAEAGEEHLAEVFLGGLLREGPSPGSYDFRPGVRAYLNDLLCRDDLLTVLRRSIKLVTAAVPADIEAVLTGPAGLDDQPDSVRQVTASVLARLGSDYQVRPEPITAAPLEIESAEKPEPRSRLAGRIRQLRKESWPDVALTQKQVAAALQISTSLLAAWENVRRPVTPPDSQLERLARFFASRRSATSGLPPTSTFSVEERERYERLLVELRELGEAVIIPVLQSAPGNFWQFPENQDVTIVCAEDPHRTINDETGADLPMSSYIDLDSLIELYGHIRALNPDNWIKIVGANSLTMDDYTGHLIALGGVDFNPLTREIMNFDSCPVRQGAREIEGSDGVFFAGKREFRSTVSNDDQMGQSVLEDIGFLFRGISRFNRKRSVTVLAGNCAKGTLGITRSMTDSRFRERNSHFLLDRFAGGESFGILARVPIIAGQALTPDFKLAETLLFEWP